MGCGASVQRDPVPGGPPAVQVPAPQDDIPHRPTVEEQEAATMEVKGALNVLNKSRSELRDGKSERSHSAKSARTTTGDPTDEGSTSDREDEVETMTDSVLSLGLNSVMGMQPSGADERASPEHFYLLFSLWPVVRPGVPEFLRMLEKKKSQGEVEQVFISVQHASTPWVRFILHCIVTYYKLGAKVVDGIKGHQDMRKVIPDDSVLYDADPGDYEGGGRCVLVEPYTNEVPWKILTPLFQKIPDHGEDFCPCWGSCGGLKCFMEVDRMWDAEHCPECRNDESDRTFHKLAQEFVPAKNVILALDNTILAGSRLVSYFDALNHFLIFREDEDTE